MGVYNYYPKGSTSSQTFGIATYTPTVKNMMYIVTHGIGQCGNGSLSVLQSLVKWGDTWDGGWKYLKLAADKYGIVLVWVNTANPDFFGKGELPFALNWALAKFPTIPESKTWAFGHSLGGRGWMLFWYVELTYAKRLAGAIISAAGPYPSSDQYQNISDSGAKIWGVCATNDTTSGTDPIYVRQIYDKTKAINSAAHVMVSEFPSGTWSSDTAHNAVLVKLTKDPIEVTASITRGLSGTSIRMNLYQWCLSNPRGSIYQDPTVYYVGPKYPNTPILNVNYDMERKIALIKWADSSQQYIQSNSTGTVVNIFERLDDNNHIKLDVTYLNGTTKTIKTIGPYKV